MAESGAARLRSRLVLVILATVVILALMIHRAIYLERAERERAVHGATQNSKEKGSTALWATIQQNEEEELGNQHKGAADLVAEKTRNTSYPDSSLPFWSKYKDVTLRAAMIVAEIPECTQVLQAQLFISCVTLSERPTCPPDRSIIVVACSDARRSRGSTWFVRNGKLVDENQRERLLRLGSQLVDRQIQQFSSSQQ